VAVRVKDSGTLGFGLHPLLGQQATPALRSASFATELTSSLTLVRWVCTSGMRSSPISLPHAPAATERAMRRTALHFAIVQRAGLGQSKYVRAEFRPLAVIVVASASFGFDCGV
jgi:hypothetical protein